jgi:hypothetical protein
MFTSRYWGGGVVVVLCTLLSQNCQPHSVSVIDTDEEEEPVAGPSSFVSTMCQCASSESLAMRSLAPPSAFSAACVASSRLSMTLANEKMLSTASPTRLLNPPARRILAIVGNSPRAPYNLPAAEVLRASHVVLLEKTGYTFSPDSPCVCVSRVEGVLGEMPSDEEENSKPFTKQRSSSLTPEDERANKKVRIGESRERRYIRQNVLNMLLAMAGSEPSKAAQLLDFLLVAAQDNDFRQQALEAFGKVAKASPDMFSACLPSLRAAAKAVDKDVRLLSLKTLGEVEWKYYFGDVGPAPDLPSNMGAILDSTCPFWPGKKVRDTHLLVLIPATVNGEPFTLNLLGELIQRPSNGGIRRSTAITMAACRRSLAQILL